MYRSRLFAPVAALLSMAAPAIAGDSVTRVFQPGDGGAWSANHDWRLVEKYPSLTGTPWTDHVHVGRDATDVSEHRMVVVAPDFIGNAAGQVPTGAAIESATIRLLTSAPSVAPLEVRRILEPHLGRAGGGPGLATSVAPSWGLRWYDTPWSTPGAGWPGSSAARALDTAVADQGGAWVEFDVTGAVQAWVDDPTSNHGLLFSAADLSTTGPTLKGGNAAPAHRPIVTVTYADVADVTGPALEIASAAAPSIGPAYVHGSCGPDAVEVSMAAGRVPVAVTRASPTTWHASVPLGETDVPIAVTARDAAGNETVVRQSLRLAPIDLARTSSVSVAVGDAFVMRTSTRDAGATYVRYDAGDSTLPVVLPAGAASLPVAYATPGVRTARATRLDATFAPLGEETMEVVVADVRPAAPLAVQQRHLREAVFRVDPPAAAGMVEVRAADPTRVHVGPAVVVGDEVRVALADLGNRAVQSWVELFVGERLVGRAPVTPFLLHHDPIQSSGPAVEFAVRVAPASVLQTAPDLRFRVELFSDASSFPPALDPDGDRVIVVGADAFADDGTLTLPAVQDWQAAAEFCRMVTALDASPIFAADDPPQVPVSEAIGRNGGDDECGFTVTIDGPRHVRTDCFNITFTAVVDPPSNDCYFLWNGQNTDGGPTFVEPGTSSPGTYPISVTAVCDGCERSAETSVTFHDPCEVEVSSTESVILMGEGCQISQGTGGPGATLTVTGTCWYENELHAPICEDEVAGAMGFEESSSGPSGYAGLQVTVPPGLPPGAYAYYAWPWVTKKEGRVTDYSDCVGTFQSFAVWSHSFRQWHYGWKKLN